MFNEEIYTEIGRVTIDSLLGPLSANIYTTPLEEE